MIRAVALHPIQVTGVVSGPSVLHVDGRVVPKYIVAYSPRGQQPQLGDETLEEEQLRSFIVVDSGIPQRTQIVEGIKKGFEYLKSRLTGTCQAAYSCAQMYAVLKAIRVMDPAFACEKSICGRYVDDLVDAVPALKDHADDLKKELPTYLRAAKGVKVDRTDVTAFTEAVLNFWKGRARELPHWARAARSIFSISPNSCACERVFSLMKSMFTPAQRTALMDYVEGSLMLAYNNR